MAGLARSSIDTKVEGLAETSAFTGSRHEAGNDGSEVCEPRRASVLFPCFPWPFFFDLAPNPHSNRLRISCDRRSIRVTATMITITMAERCW
jgi:hypothetical protein